MHIPSIVTEEVHYIPQYLHIHYINRHVARRAEREWERARMEMEMNQSHCELDHPIR